MSKEQSAMFGAKAQPVKSHVRTARAIHVAAKADTDRALGIVHKASYQYHQSLCIDDLMIMHYAFVEYVNLKEQSDTLWYAAMMDATS